MPHKTARFVCPFCQVPVLVAENLWGQFVACPACRRQFHVPNPDVDVEQEGPPSESVY